MNGTAHYMQRARLNNRLRDIAESQGLLLELVTTEPTIMQCFKIIESTCLSQGIFCRIQGVEVSPKFQRFLEEHYAPFCKAAIRAMFTYGFVPWRTRRLGRGDEVPEVLAPGTFSWHTEVGPDEQQHNPSRYYRPRKRASPPSICPSPGTTTAGWWCTGSRPRRAACGKRTSRSSSPTRPPWTCR